MQQITLNRGDNGTSLNLVAHAAMPGSSNYQPLYLLSATSSQSCVKAATAMLRHKDGCSFTLGGTHCSKCTDFKWKIVSCPLGLDTFHLLAWCLDPKFLPRYTSDHLWAMFNGERFTTPLLSHWQAYVVGACDRFIKPMGGGAAYCTLTSEGLDQIVTEGVRTCRIRIE